MTSVVIAANVPLRSVFKDTPSLEQPTGAIVLQLYINLGWLMIHVAFDFSFDLPHYKDRATSAAERES